MPIQGSWVGVDGKKGGFGRLAGSEVEKKTNLITELEFSLEGCSSRDAEWSTGGYLKNTSSRDIQTEEHSAFLQETLRNIRSLKM